MIHVEIYVNINNTEHSCENIIFVIPTILLLLLLLFF